MGKKLYKSSLDRKICGVCGGFAEFFGIDATILRLLVVLFTLAGGSGVLFYIVAALIMPDEPEYGYFKKTCRDAFLNERRMSGIIFII